MPTLEYLAEIELLKQKLTIEREKVRKAREALKFYADGKHWSTTEHEENLFIRINDADWTHRNEGGFVGGKIANQALKELGEE